MGADVITGAAGNTLTASNDITISGDDVTAGDLALLVAGDRRSLRLTMYRCSVILYGRCRQRCNQRYDYWWGDVTLGNGMYRRQQRRYHYRKCWGDAIWTTRLSSRIKGHITGGQIDGSGAITADDGDISQQHERYAHIDLVWHQPPIPAPYRYQVLTPSAM